MLRLSPLMTLGTLVVFVSACPDDPPVSAEDTSSGGPPVESDSPATDDGPVTTGLDGSTSDDTTTTGSAMFGQARFIVRERIATSSRFDLVLREYADGELSSPTTVAPALAMGSGVGSTDIPSWGEYAAYCISNPAKEGRSCFATDVSTNPPGAPQPFNAPPVPSPATVSLGTWVEQAQTFVYQAVATAENTDQALYSARFTAGVLQAPQVVATPTPGATIADPTPRSDGAWVAYVNIPDAGPRSVFLAPLDAPNPGAAIMVSDVVDPDLRTQRPAFVPGLDALIYSVGSVGAGATIETFQFVDFSGPVPSAPIRIDDPLDDALQIRRPRIAPDGHALIYWVGGDGITGDLKFVDLSGGTPQPPVLVSLGLNETLASDFDWSPDSRWIHYRGAHDQSETFALHLIEAPGSVPGVPVNITGGLVPGGDVSTQRFDDSSSWLYYVAQQEALNAEMFRVDISGAEPGPPQKVSGPLTDGSLSGELIPSQDWSMLLYTAEDGSPRAQQLYRVDISGPQPGKAVRVNAPLADDVDVGFGAKFSADGSCVLYGERGPTLDDPTPLFLVDLESETVVGVSDDAQGVSPIVD